LWAHFDQLTVESSLADLRTDFEKDRIWMCETDAGVRWMASHLDASISGYVNLTAAALKNYRKRLPALKKAAYR
jgi:hypothetical protein